MTWRGGGLIVVACAASVACKGTEGGGAAASGAETASGSAAGAGSASDAGSGAETTSGSAAGAGSGSATVGIDGTTLVVTAADGTAFDAYAEPRVDGGYPPCFRGATARVAQGVQTCARADGTQHGPQVGLWGNGQRKEYAVYVDGVMRGPQVGWDEQGRMTFHAFNNPQGKWIGTVTRWRDGKKDGPETTYDADGKQGETTSWVGGVKTRSNAFECPAGTTKKVASGLTLTEDSMREDRTRITCERGGKPNGPYVDEYPGGTFEIVGTMADGKRSGAETGYYDTGEKFWVGKRANDRRVGTWTTWYPPGHKSTETDYNAKGQRVEERQYDDAGAVKGGTRYRNDEYVDSWVGPKKPR